MAEGQVRMSDDVWIKRMGETGVNRTYLIGEGDEGREGTGGRILPIYKMAENDG